MRLFARPRPPFHAGFTLTEVLLTLVILGVIAGFTLPKIMSSTGDKQVVALLKESFSTIGETALARQNDSMSGPPSIGSPGESTILYSYFKKRLNSLNTDPTAPLPAPSTLCTTPQDYFVLPNKTTVRSICQVNTPAATPPLSTQIGIRVYRSNGDAVDYTLVVPKDQARYTTLYGYNTAVAANCNTLVDSNLGVIQGVCP